jgi:hypothetical protein
MSMGGDMDESLIVCSELTAHRALLEAEKRFTWGSTFPVIK